MVSIHENDVFEQFDEIKFEECKETIHLIDKNKHVVYVESPTMKED